VPEGDTLHRAARRLQVLVGERLDVRSPHPRAQAERIPERVDGRVLERVEAVGKNLLLHFEGGLVLRSHLRMTGRWSVVPRGSARSGRPWLEQAAVLMRASVETGRQAKQVYRRAGRRCPRCRTPIRSRGQGDANRIAYWCPSCQRGEDPPAA